MRVRVFPMGEGAVNTLGGLRPNTVVANISGNLKDFWKVLAPEGVVLNWSGEPSPVVHQLDHFYDELRELSKAQGQAQGQGGKDEGWQAIKASRCLWGCADSPSFSS